TLITILGKRSHDIKLPTDQPEFSTLNALSADIGLLLSFIVKYSVSDSDKQDHCYQTILENLFDNPADIPPRTAIEQFKPIQFRNIIEKINKLTPDLKQKVLTACIELITLDHHINAEEAELITAIAECFDSPLPPVLMDDLS
ncbi:hypothetical protein KDA11_04385, partial [Candidatus Saccharibacteria bacterium]|nr:hypothetical protein [Candidatus Saccharibacteria bacterium]